MVCPPVHGNMRRCIYGGETRGGSSPPFGTIAMLKGNLALARFPFSAFMVRVAQIWFVV